MVARNQVARRPRGLALDFRAAPAGAYALYKAGSRALQPREKPRKTSKGKQKEKKNAVSSMPKDRIGRNAGLIVSNQRVPRPKAGSVQYRRTVFGSVQQADKVWLGGSTIGDQSTQFKTIAHAILAHYLPKMGDMRASNVQEPSLTKVFTSFSLEYAKDAPSSNITGSAFNLGSAIANADYLTMANALGAQIQTYARQGQYPMSIGFILLDGGTLLSVLRDQQVGRHTITVSCQGKFRFQNVTPGGTTESVNINAIDASPVNGKIYTFRNQAPLFAPGYTEALTDAPTKLAIEQLQDVARPFEIYGTTTPAGGGKGGAAFTHITAPPLNPKSIWRNVSSTGVAVFPPGGFKTYNTSYLRSETIFKYCQSISQDDLTNTVTYAEHATYPPAGDSFMMCLRPTIKVSGGEIIKMAYNVDYILKASIKRVKRSPLQVVNIIE